MTAKSWTSWVVGAGLAVSAPFLSACKNESPFEAVLACNRVLETAIEMPSCVKSLKGNPSEFYIEAPRLLEVSSENNGATLQIIDGKCPHCSLVNVKLEGKLLGGWRVSEWQRYTQYARDLDPQHSTHADVRITGDVEWTSSDLIYQRIRSGRCQLRFDHVALWAQLTAPVHCKLLRTPGQYNFETFYPEDGNALFVDHAGFISGPGGEYQDVYLTIEPALDGHTSGRLELAFIKLGRRYAVTYTFKNVPIALDE